MDNLRSACDLGGRADTSARLDSLRIAFTGDGVRVRFSPDNVVIRMFGLNNGVRLLEVEAYDAEAKSRKWGDGSVVLRLFAEAFDITADETVLELRNGGAVGCALLIRVVGRCR